MYFQFVTLSVMNLEFGTMMAMLSLVRTVVLRAPKAEMSTSLMGLAATFVDDAVEAKAA